MLLTARKNHDSQQAQKKSRGICEGIKALREFQDAAVIYGYIPVRGEVDVRSLLEEAFRQEKRVALPRCLDRRGHMAFFEIRSFSDLVPGAFHIPEPGEGLKKMDVRNGVMLVPGVGYDRSCSRLGYGGGYYDRFIGKTAGVSCIAPAYDFQLTDLLPVEVHDARVDMIVTEKQIIKRRMEDD